jgi:hypothetical protein
LQPQFICPHQAQPTNQPTFGSLPIIDAHNLKTSGNQSIIIIINHGESACRVEPLCHQLGAPGANHLL